MNDEMFRLSLIDITNNDLLNDFVNNTFGYDFDLKKEEYVYIQYKIISGNIILNIYDNKNSNRFKAYIFTLNNIESDDNSIYINVNNEYDKYKIGSKNSLCLLSSLLVSKDSNEKKEIIESLFSGKIKDIFIHYSSIMSEGYKTLVEGQYVEFELVRTDKGLQAKNVVEIKTALV